MNCDKPTSMPDPFWLIIDISRSTAYTGSVREVRDLLLARAKALNPQLTSWDRAIDPTYKVSEISTRTGKKRVRAFQPPLPLLRVLQGAESGRNKGPSKKVVVRGSKTATPTETRNPSALQVPIEPTLSDPAPEIESATDWHREQERTKRTGAQESP